MNSFMEQIQTSRSCISSALVIAVLIAMATGLEPSVWLPQRSNIATSFQTPGLPEAISGPESQGRVENQDFFPVVSVAHL